MRLLGVLGGMSWTSTAEYYRLLNLAVAERLGGRHSARLLLHSVDFDEIATQQHRDDWAGATTTLVQAASGLGAAGAEALLLATNTMHKVADEVEARSGLPLLHIGDPTASAIRTAGLDRVGLLATGFTMEQAFYRDRLAARGVETIVPDDEDRAEVHRIIYDELCRGVVLDASRATYRRVMERLVRAGAQGIVLGCTEITLLVGADDVDVPVFDTTRLHVGAAVEWLVG